MGEQLGEITNEWAEIAEMTDVTVTYDTITDDNVLIVFDTTDSWTVSSSTNEWVELPDTAAWANTTTTFTDKDLDLSAVETITLSPQLKQQLKSEIKKEVNTMNFELTATSLSMGTWIGIFILVLVVVKLNRVFTLKNLFRPTKKAAKMTKEAVEQTTEHVKKEWEDA